MIKKTIIDTLQNKEGKVSRKSITMFVSMAMLCSITWSEMITSMPILESYKMTINESVLWLFGSLVGGLAGITVWDKKNV